MSGQWLIMRCSAEFDDVLAVAHCPNGLFENVVKRHEALVDFSKTEGQGELSEAAYWYSIDAYEMSNVIYDFLPEDEKDHFVEHDWVLVDEHPDAGPLGLGLEDIRATVCELKIALPGKSFNWTFVPKHGSTAYETPPISFGELAGRGLLNK